MRVVAGKGLSGFIFKMSGDIGPQGQFFGLEQILIFRRRGVIWCVGRAPRKKKGKGCDAGVLANVPLGLTTLGNRIVPLPFKLYVLIGVIERVIVVVRTAQHLPKLETLPPVSRDKRTSFIPIQMPFADMAGLVTRFVISLGDGNSISIQTHIIQKHAVSQWISAGH
ncbi:hypothetical protein ES703_83521 [subsurface metagenome]